MYGLKVLEDFRCVVNVILDCKNMSFSMIVALSSI